MLRFDRGRRSRTAVAPLERLKILQQVRLRLVRHSSQRVHFIREEDEVIDAEPER